MPVQKKCLVVEVDTLVVAEDNRRIMIALLRFFLVVVLVNLSACSSLPEPSAPKGRITQNFDEAISIENKAPKNAKVSPFQRVDSKEEFAFMQEALERVDRENASLSQRRLIEILRAQVRFFSNYKKGTRMSSAENISAYRRLRSMWEEYFLENSKDADALIVFGKFLRRTGDPSAAYGIFCQADKARHTDAITKQQMATYEGEIGMFKEAYSHLQDAINLDADNPIYLGQLAQLILFYRERLSAELKLSTKELDEKMLGAYQRVAEILPENMDAQTRYAQAFYDVVSADWNKALVQWNKVEKLAQLNLEKQTVKANKARVLIELHRDKEAQELLREVTLPSLARSKAALLGVIEDAQKEKQ